MLTILTRAAMIGCGLIFLTAGIEKLRHRHILPGVIADYRILPPSLVPAASAALPPLECALGLMLLPGLMLPSGLTLVPAIAGAALLIAFAAAMAVNLLRGRRAITCGCGRLDLRQELRWASVGRNAVLAALLLGAPAFGGALDAMALDAMAPDAMSPDAMAPDAMSPDAMAMASAAFGGVAIWIANLLFEAIGALAAASVSMRRSH